MIIQSHLFRRRILQGRRRSCIINFETNLSLDLMHRFSDSFDGETSGMHEELISLHDTA